MGKKLRYTSKKKSTVKDLDEENISKKKKQVTKAQKNNKPGKVKDQNVKFKNKHGKSTQNLKKKLKKLQKNEGAHSNFSFLNSNIANVTNIKKKIKGKEAKSQNKNERKQANLQKAGKVKKPKHGGNQSIKQTNKKANNVRVPAKQAKNSLLLNAKETSNRKHKKTKRQKQIVSDDKVAKVNPSALKKSKEKKKKQKPLVPLIEKSKKSNTTLKHRNLDINRLEEMLTAKQAQIKTKKENLKTQPLRDRMMSKLKASRFRYLNETMYSSESSESKKYFKDDPDAFKAYHEGYKQQVAQWPLNPLDVIISSIKKMPKDYVIADFGCGEARLAASVTQRVHSFDFISLNKNVTVCDIAHTPLLTNGVHVVVFCLSLMGTNLKDYIIEANRILKKDGILKIAEVESRFDRIEDFIKVLSGYGFKNTLKDLSHNLFYFLDFKKEKDIGGRKSKLSPITLKPCLYKKR
ncbi:uncharacterized protein LOC143216622 [Lasioglossum baleicum]|uniref:uncharacterized protein LOC143216622 n=1 Tax=Lasioglossum baleicum TaxID=434251 RepID=UPI003FCE100E